MLGSQPTILSTLLSTPEHISICGQHFRSLNPACRNSNKAGWHKGAVFVGYRVTMNEVYLLPQGRNVLGGGGVYVSKIQIVGRGQVNLRTGIHGKPFLSGESAYRKLSRYSFFARKGK